MKYINLMFEMLYRNICFRNISCNGCILRDETYQHVATGYKTDDACLMGNICIFDFIKKEKTCEGCVCFNHDTWGCKIINNHNHTLRLQYYGYWKVDLND